MINLWNRTIFVCVERANMCAQCTHREKFQKGSQVFIVRVNTIKGRMRWYHCCSARKMWKALSHTICIGWIGCVSRTRFSAIADWCPGCCHWLNGKSCGFVYSNEQRVHLLFHGSRSQFQLKQFSEATKPQIRAHFRFTRN